MSRKALLRVIAKVAFFTLKSASDLGPLVQKFIVFLKGFSSFESLLAFGAFKRLCHLEKPEPSWN